MGRGYGIADTVTRQCPTCGKWFSFDPMAQVSCTVLHPPGECCHHGQQEIGSPSTVSEPARPPWHKRSHQQWAIRYDGRTCKLMMRYADTDGLDSDGKEASWKDVATIHEDFWADTILSRLRG